MPPSDVGAPRLSSAESVGFVATDVTARQRRNSKLYKAAIISGVLLVAAVIATAIAVPLAISTCWPPAPYRTRTPVSSTVQPSSSSVAPSMPTTANQQQPPAAPNVTAPAPEPSGPTPVVITVQGSDAKLKWSLITQDMFEEEYKDWKGVHEGTLPQP